MLRLKAPGSERLLQSGSLEASFGGGEANVAVSLARFGNRAEYLSSVPPGPLGDAAIACLRAQGVGTANLRRDLGRLGLYFLENGSNQRPSQVLYDRQDSSFAQTKPESWDWPSLFRGAEWFHLTGITPALSETCATTSLQATQAARALGIPVSVDLNYRGKLWKWGKAATQVMPQLCAAASHLFANEEDIQQCLGLAMPATDKPARELDPHGYRQLCEQVLDSYPNLKMVAITLRESISADRNRWMAVLHSRDEFMVAKTYDLSDIVDRIGAGDAFAAGFIHGHMNRWEKRESLEFATAASCLKHSIPGDFNLVSAEEVRALVAGSGSGRIVR